MPVTDEQAKDLARMATAGRPYGAPRWDAPGVYAAIRKVSHLALTDVMRAVANATDNRDLVNPGSIANLSSSCWRPTQTAAPVFVPDTWDDPRDRCAECSKSKSQCESIPMHVSGHKFRSILDHERDADTRRLNVPATVQGIKQTAVEPHPEETP